MTALAEALGAAKIRAALPMDSNYATYGMALGPAPEGQVREVVWQDPNAVFAVRVGQVLNQGSFRLSTGSAFHYHHFAWHMPGQVVNGFVHAKNVTPGVKVWARVKVIRKIFADARSYLHIDLYPMDEFIRRTHQLNLLVREQAIENFLESFPFGGRGARIVISSVGQKVQTAAKI